MDLSIDQTRSYECRAEASGEKREISGIGVPLGEQIEVFPGFREEFDQECEFVGIERAKLRFQHSEVIGVIAEARREKGKLSIRGRVSQTGRGDEALTLTRDGALDSFSIGFRPVEWIENEDGSVRHTKVRVREFSLVDQPAYPTAAVTDVRSAHTAPERSTTMPKPKAPEVTDETRSTDVEELRGAVDDLSRAFTSFRTHAEEEPEIETRSAGEILKALAAGDEDTIRSYNELQERAYAGGTTADAAIKNSWVGDLTRIYDASTGLLVDTFATGNLPASGMNIEYAELAANTMKVEEQAAEGDDLPMGKVSLTTKTAPVKTYGGGTELTRQEIERSQLPILNRNLEALAMAAGVRHKLVMRAAYNAVVTAQTAANDVVSIKTSFTAEDILDAVVDAALNFEDKAAPLERWLVNASLFKGLNKLKINGTRIFSVNGNDKTVGNLDLSALKGDIASLEVRLDAGAPRVTDAGAFVNGRAIRSYTSSLVSLQDEKILNLSKQFSVYRYGAIAKEIPGFVVPVKFAA